MKPTRCCTRCKVELPLSAFSRHRDAPDGRRSRCRACESDVRRLRVQTPAGTKECRSCHEVQPFEAFAKHSCKKDGHRSWCRSCVASGRTSEQAVEHRVEQRRRTLQSRRLVAGLALAAGEKKCAGPCGLDLPLEEFWRRVDSLDGHGAWCRTCGTERRSRPDPVDLDRWTRWRDQRQEYADLVAQLSTGGSLLPRRPVGVSSDGDSDAAENPL
jgi:hypothetical protein